MADDITPEELVEVTASIVLVMPPSVTFEEALKTAIFAQPWAENYPSFAQKFYDNLISNPEMAELLRRFPGEISVEELLTKVQELANQLLNPTDQLTALSQETSDVMSFVDAIWEHIKQQWEEVGEVPPPIDVQKQFDYSIRYSDIVISFQAQLLEYTVSWEEVAGQIIAMVIADPSLFPMQFDPGSLMADISTLFKLLSWNPVAEQLLINQLRENLKKLDEMPMRIGGQIVPVPFLDQFGIFLAKMEERQTELGQLWADYFGDEGKEWREKAFKWLTDHIFSQENVESAFQFYLDSLKGTPLGYAIDMTQLGWEHLVEPAIGEDAANSILAALATKVYAVSQVGTNLQEALIADPQNALVGVAVGMVEASALGLFLDISAAYISHSFETYNKYGANLPTIKPGWWQDIIGIDTTNPAFQSGEAAGKLGMTVSDLVVGTSAAFTGGSRLGGSTNVIQSGGNILALGRGVITLAQAEALGLAVVGTVGVVQGGCQAGQFFAKENKTPDSPPDEEYETPEEARSAAGRYRDKVTGDYELDEPNLNPDELRETLKRTTWVTQKMDPTSGATSPEKAINLARATGTIQTAREGRVGTIELFEYLDANGNARVVGIVEHTYHEMPSGEIIPAQHFHVIEPPPAFYGDSQGNYIENFIQYLIKGGRYDESTVAPHHIWVGSNPMK
jgi:hypothetical protein